MKKVSSQCLTLKWWLQNSQNIRKIWLGMVAHACNCNTWEAKEGRSRGQEFKTNLTNMVKPYLY